MGFLGEKRHGFPQLVNLFTMNSLNSVVGSPLFVHIMEESIHDYVEYDTDKDKLDK